MYSPAAECNRVPRGIENLAEIPLIFCYGLSEAIYVPVNDFFLFGIVV